MGTYYKVVSRIGHPEGTFGTFFVHTNRVAYRIGETTRPPKGWGPLAAFSTEREARDIILLHGHFAVLRGSGVPNTSQARCAMKLWRPDERGQIISFPEENLPKGTVLLDEFTPEAVLGDVA